MTTLQEAATASSTSMRVVERVARGLGRFSRRGFLVQTAVVGSALAVDAKGFVLKPQTAASTVCGPAASCAAGYTVMCCTINKGVNACPPGTFAAGWWKAADSSWCCGGYRYITDCNATCSGCSSGCSGDNICDKGCWSCSCTCGSSATCDQRRVCCNAFRYGQCNTQVRCSGGVACRVVSCVAPYKWANCTTTSLTDNSTAEHNAPCLQGCGPILTEYDRLGANGSSLGASTGPQRAVGDGRGQYVNYQHGGIYWTSSTGAHRVVGGMRDVWVSLDGTQGVLGYPRTDMVRTKDGRGYVQEFEHGLLVDPPSLPVRRVSGSIRSRWIALGRETGALGYPTASMVSGRVGAGYLQSFQHGLLVNPPRGGTWRVSGGVQSKWVALGRESGRLGYPTADMTRSPDGAGYRQQFERGLLVDGPSTPTCAVLGRVLSAWLDAGAERSTWGYPLDDTVDHPDGSQSQTFQGGVLTA